MPTHWPTFQFLAMTGPWPIGGLSKHGIALHLVPCQNPLERSFFDWGISERAGHYRE